MSHQEAGRFQRKPIAGLQDHRLSKLPARLGKEERELFKYTTKPHPKKEGSRHQGQITWNKKKNLASSSLVPHGLNLCAPETSYQPQPERQFSAEEAQKVMKSVLERQLGNSSYEGKGCSHLAMEVVESVKQAVRDLGYERYKLVCYAVLGPVSRTGLCCGSKSIWSPASDTYAEYLFQNRFLFALCVVYAGYYE